MAGRMRNGQAALEYVISLAGAVALVYISLNVWSWLNRMLVERQAIFNATREAAGHIQTAGQPVEYHRPQLRLIGPPQDDNTGGIGDPGDIPVLEPPCDAARPFTDAANLRRGELPYISARLDLVGIKMQIIGRRMRWIGNEMQRVCEDHENYCNDLQQRLRRRRRQLKKLQCNELNPLIARQNQLLAEISMLYGQALIACQVGSPGEPPPYERSSIAENTDDPPCPAAQPYYDLAATYIDQVLDLLQQRNDALAHGQRQLARQLYQQAVDLMNDADDQINTGDDQCPGYVDPPDPEPAC